MKFDISKYLILGRENTKSRTVEEVVKAAVEAGFTFIQIRSKEETALEMIEDCLKVSDLLKKMGKSDEVSVVVDDRLDVILAAREKAQKSTEFTWVRQTFRWKYAANIWERTRLSV